MKVESISTHNYPSKEDMDKPGMYVVLRVLENIVVEVYDIFDTLHYANIMIESENEKPHLGVIQVVNIMG